MSGIVHKYKKRVNKVRSLLCIGLDPDISGSQFEFNKKIIKETYSHVTSYKMNTAFYEARGDEGIRDLKKTVEYLRDNYPDIITIVDAKRADIANTSKAYATFVFDWLGFDSVTLNPYLGREALVPFLERDDKFSFILCRTSNEGSDEFQELVVGDKPFWQVVAEHVSGWGENVGLVVGAPHVDELKKIRDIAGDMLVLIPGIGAQEGSIQDVVENAPENPLIHSARSIIFSDNPEEGAKKLKEEINQYR